VTDTVACAWAERDPALHTIVYVYVPAAAKLTAADPASALGPAQPSPVLPPEAVHDVALDDVHVSVVDCPTATLAGLGDSETEGTV
jgi:hypothetical protein